MSELNIKESFSNRERNVDALFGFRHIKDKPFLHQRAAQHIFGENDSAVVVPLSTLNSMSEERSSKAKRALKIAIISLAITGVFAFSVYLFRVDPGLLIPFL